MALMILFCSSQPHDPRRRGSTNISPPSGSAGAIAELRKTEVFPNHLLAHLSPLGWEHVNLTGDYIWNAVPTSKENNVGLIPLRTLPEAA